MQRVKVAIVAVVLLTGVTVLAQRNAFNTRLRTDANGYLVTSNLAYTGPDGPLTAFPNLRLKTDANGYLQTTMNGAQTVSVSGQATTSTDGFVLQNTTAATGGATVQISPRLSWIGTAWDTAASETVAFFSEVLPATAATPTGTWKLGYSLNGAAATYPLTVTSAGAIGAASGTFSGNMSVNSNQITGAQWTAGSGTGITNGNNGNNGLETAKITIASTACIAAAVTCDVTIGTLPAKMFVKHVLADLTTTFACASVCTTSTLSATLGKTAGANQYLVSFDADAATGQFGDAAAELGASLAPATAPTLIGDLGSWAGTQTMVLRITSGTGNLGTGAATNLSQGTIVFYVTTEKMP